MFYLGSRLAKVLEPLQLDLKNISDEGLLHLTGIVSYGSQRVEMLEETPDQVLDVQDFSFNQTQSLQLLQNLEK